MRAGVLIQVCGCAPFYSTHRLMHCTGFMVQMGLWRGYSISHLKMNDGKAMYINDEFANFLTQLGLNKGKGGGVHDVALFLKVCKIIAEFVSTSSPLNPMHI